MHCSKVSKLSCFVEDQFRLLFESNEVQRKDGIYFFQLISVTLEISLSAFQYLLRFSLWKPNFRWERSYISYGISS